MTEFSYFDWLDDVLACMAKGELSATEGQVVIRLSRYADYATGENAHPGEEGLIRTTGASESTVQRAMRKGITLGLIELVSRGGGERASKYALTRHPRRETPEHPSPHPSPMTGVTPVTGEGSSPTPVNTPVNTPVTGDPLPGDRGTGGTTNSSSASSESPPSGEPPTVASSSPGVGEFDASVGHGQPASPDPLTTPVDGVPGHPDGASPPQPPAARSLGSPATREKAPTPPGALDPDTIASTAKRVWPLLDSRNGHRYLRKRNGRQLQLTSLPQLVREAIRDGETWEALRMADPDTHHTFAIETAKVLDFRRQQCAVCGEPSTRWRDERGHLIPVCDDHHREVEVS